MAVLDRGVRSALLAEIVSGMALTLVWIVVIGAWMQTPWSIWK